MSKFRSWTRFWQLLFLVNCGTFIFGGLMGKMDAAFMGLGAMVLVDAIAERR